jgi:hypothetical protein
LDDQHFSESDGKLDVSVELGILVVHDLEVLAVLFKAEFQPFTGLGSWVDDQRSALGIHDHDGILHTEVVRREAFFLPGQHLTLRAEVASEIVVF